VESYTLWLYFVKFYDVLVLIFTTAGIWCLGFWPSKLNTVLLRRVQFQIPYSLLQPPSYVTTWGLLSFWTGHQITRNISAIVLWWYHANSDTRRMQLEPRNSPLENTFL
jgi:hypothetical protein